MKQYSKINAAPVAQNLQTNVNLTIAYGFRLESVLRKDFSEFLTRWPAPHGPDLRNYFDTFVFYVNGFDHDPREVFQIPEVRTFYCGFREAWPLWLFACKFNMPLFQPMLFCCLDSLRITQRQGHEVYRVDFDPAEMGTFLSVEVSRMEVLCRQAGMSPDQIRHRAQFVWNYFGFRATAQTNS
jgi:hypothetical protein